jgi:uncharacterized membrane protein
MPSLTVWRFSTPLGVDAGELQLKRLQEQQALVVHDAAALIWMPGAEKAELRHLRHDTTKAATTGTIVGGLIGALVLAPVAGAAVGGTAAAAVHRLRHHGISDDFVDSVRAALTPGTSALFVLSSDARPELVAPAVAKLDATLIRAEIGDEVAEELRDLLPRPEEG